MRWSLVSQGKRWKRNNAIVRMCPQSSVTAGSAVWSGKSCCSCVSLWPRWELPVPWGVTGHHPLDPFQVRGRKWSTFPGACWDFWVNSGRVERLHNGASNLAEAFCIFGTQTTRNFQFITISVCIYLHSWWVHKWFSWSLFHTCRYIRLLLCIFPALDFLSAANLSSWIQADQQSWQYLEL